MTKRVEYSEVRTYWRGITTTLKQRGLLRQFRETPTGGKEPVLPCTHYLVQPDYVAFVLDMFRLAGVSREQWLDADMWAQLRATLQGRRCFVADGAGLAVVVARNPDAERAKLPRLPATIPLDLCDLPEKPYTVTLGHTRRGPVTLDLAGKHRAILVGGTSGSGKTNVMQSVILQLAAKHTPSEVAFAIVDTKEVDFGSTFERLPHLFAPIAHTLEESARLIEAVEVERLRRQAVMAAAGVADWRDCDGLGLLVLLVDEAADHTRTPAMATLIDVARKGRAMGISIILGTQSPSSKVIDGQVKANLPTAIAFQTRSDVESRVILGKSGAEKLNRPGLALTFIGGRWQEVQTLRVDLEAVAGVAAPARPALSDIERALVAYALQELDGAFIVGKLYQAHKGQISQRRLTALAQTWESRGWLTTPAHATDPRRVTPELLALIGPPYGVQSGDTVIGMIGGDRDARAVIGNELPPFLAHRAVIGQ